MKRIYIALLAAIVLGIQSVQATVVLHDTFTEPDATSDPAVTFLLGSHTVDTTSTAPNWSDDGDENGILSTETFTNGTYQLAGRKASIGFSAVGAGQSLKLSFTTTDVNPGSSTDQGYGFELLNSGGASVFAIGDHFKAVNDYPLVQGWSISQALAADDTTLDTTAQAPSAADNTDTVAGVFNYDYDTGAWILALTNTTSGTEIWSASSAGTTLDGSSTYVPASAALSSLRIRGSKARSFTLDEVKVEVFGTPAPAAPPAWTEDPVSGSPGTTGRAYTGTLAGKAIDPNGDPITYSKAAGDAWLSIAGNGALSGTPVAAGTNTFTVTATDVDGSTNATLQIVVTDPAPPVWSANPITGNPGTTGLSYTGTLNGLATDADGNTITYSKAAGPAWLTIDSDGTLSGIPPAAGTDVFTVTATDVDGSVDTILNIVVSDLPTYVGVVLYDTFTDADGTALSAHTVDTASTETTWAGSGAASTILGGTVAMAANGQDANIGFGALGANQKLILTFETAAAGFGQVDGQGFELALDRYDGVNVFAIGDNRADYRDYQADDPYQASTLGWMIGDSYEAATFASRWQESGGDTTGTVLGTFIYEYDSGAWSLTLTNTQTSTEIWATTSTNTTVNGSTYAPANEALARFSMKRENARYATVDWVQVEIQNVSGTASPVTDLSIAGPVLGGTSMVISWTSENGSSYGVETNSNLIIGDWQTFKTGLIGNGGTFSVTNTMGPDQTFYRVIPE